MVKEGLKQVRISITKPVTEVGDIFILSVIKTQVLFNARGSLLATKGKLFHC